MNIGVDLGGTNVRVGLVDGVQILKLVSDPSKSDKSEAEVIDQIISLIERVLCPEVQHIGIGVPSVVDSKRGVVYNVIGIPSWKEVHLKERLEAYFKIPVSVDNDCNCFAIGVNHFENTIQYKNMVCMALGTGVGAGIIIDGELYSGGNTGAGEFGSVAYLDKDYEYYCSSRFFVGRGTTGKQAYECALQGDAQALDLWREFGVHVGNLVQLVLFTFDPNALVFGGSISSAFDFFKDSMMQQIQKFPYPKTVEHLTIYPSKIQNIGVLGASVEK